MSADPLDLRSLLGAIADARPFMRISTALAIADAIEDKTPNLDDAAALSRWAMRRPVVAAEVAAGRRIQAIKELRAASNASLKQAKDAIDMLGAVR